MKRTGGEGRGGSVREGARASAVQHFGIENEESIMSASGECASGQEQGREMKRWLGMGEQSTRACMPSAQHRVACMQVHASI